MYNILRCIIFFPWCITSGVFHEGHKRRDTLFSVVVLVIFTILVMLYDTRFWL